MVEQRTICGCINPLKSIQTSNIKKRKRLKLNYRQLIDVEILRLQPEPFLKYDLGTKEARYINYALSTWRRQLFLVLATRSRMRHKYTKLYKARQLMQISRPAINQIMTECEAEGWITVQTYGRRGLRQFKGSDMTVRLFQEYADGLYNGLGIN